MKKEEHGDTGEQVEKEEVKNSTGGKIMRNKGKEGRGL